MLDNCYDLISKFGDFEDEYEWTRVLAVSKTRGFLYFVFLFVGGFRFSEAYLRSCVPVCYYLLPAMKRLLLAIIPCD